MSEYAPIIKINDLAYRYSSQVLGSLALDGVNLEVNRGEFLGVIGPNGGGKSTLLKIMLGLLKPQRGDVRIFDQTPLQARRKMGYTPQTNRIDPYAPATALDIVLSGRLSASRWGFFYGRQHRLAAMLAMERTGVADLAHRNISEMSGGQCQRVMIARALVNEPQLLLMDEPTTGIDSSSEAKLSQLLSTLSDELTVVVVTHDLGFLTGRMTRVACLNQRISCFHAKGLDEGSIQSLYLENTHALLREHGYQSASQTTDTTLTSSGEDGDPDA